MIAREHAKYTKKLTVILLVECCWWQRQCLGDGTKWRVHTVYDVQCAHALYSLHVKCKRNDTNATMPMNLLGKFYYQKLVTLDDLMFDAQRYSRTQSPTTIDIGQCTRNMLSFGCKIANQNAIILSACGLFRFKIFLWIAFQEVIMCIALTVTPANGLISFLRLKNIEMLFE